MVEKINRLIFKVATRLLKRLPALWLAAALCSTAYANQMPSIITDDETETLLHSIIEPIFKVAGVAFYPNKIYILHDDSLNAFVSDGNYMFIHTGTLLNVDNLNELSGIIAHETGHISGGHIVRQKLRVNQLQSLNIASLIAAGAAAALSGSGDAAMAIMLGSQSSLLNALISYQLQEERSADESAVKYLNEINQSPEGLQRFMQKIQKENRLNGIENTPYFRTHPMDSERMNFFNTAKKISPKNTSSSYDEKFVLVQAKLRAFLLPIKRGWQLYPQNEKSTAAQYAHAILYYRDNNLPQALKLLDKLIADYPQNPYFYELKGQFLFEKGRLKDALAAYDKAKQLRPNSPDILFAWAQTALELPHNQQQLAEIVKVLNQVQVKRPSVVVWQLLARAYEEQGKKAEMYYVSAQYSTALNNYEVARRQIRSAEGEHPSSSLQIKLRDLKHFLDLKK